MYDDAHVLGWLLNFPACSPTFKPTPASLHTQLASVGRFLHLVTQGAARHLQCHTPHRMDMPTCWFQLLPWETVNSPINLKSSIRVVWIVIKIWNFEPQYARSPVCKIKVLLQQMHSYTCCGHLQRFMDAKNVFLGAVCCNQPFMWYLMISAWYKILTSSVCQVRTRNYSIWEDPNLVFLDDFSTFRQLVYEHI